MTSVRGILSDIERRSIGGRIITSFFLLTLVVVGLAYIFPFVFAFTAGLKTSSEIFDPGLHLFPRQAHWENYAEAWRRFNMTGMFLNTIYVALGGTLGRLLVSAMAAYSLSRLKPAGQTLIQTLILVTLTVPMIAYLIPLYLTLTNLPVLHISLINKYWGLWLPYSVSAFHVMVLKNSFDQIPQDYYDAAAIDGASPLRMFLSLTLPLSSSILLVLGLLTFVGIWGDFLLPLLILRDSSLQTVSVRLYTLTRSFPMNLQMAGAFLGMIPPALAVLFLQRHMRGGLTF